MPPLVELVADRGQRRSHTLLGRQSHDLELPLLVRPTTVSESQEVERLRPALPRLRRRSAAYRPKLDQPRFTCNDSPNFVSRSCRSARNVRAVPSFSKPTTLSSA